MLFITLWTYQMAYKVTIQLIYTFWASIWYPTRDADEIYKVPRESKMYPMMILTKPFK